ncbi:MAG: DUF481 domain-containing protein [Kiritimatiellae bacterium]|nr:DUF481 domain-containing protein [Kiritimatiellia bacterium]
MLARPSPSRVWRFRRPITAAPLVAVAWAARAALNAPEVTPAVSSDHAAHLGLSLNAGNSESLRLNVGAVSAADLNDEISYHLGVDFNYGESAAGERASARDVDNGKMFGNVRWTFQPPWFAALDASAMYDRMAEIDRRVTIGPALGADLLRRPGLRWSIEAGPAMLWERVAGINDAYVAVRIAEQFDWRPDERLRIWQRLEWTADSSDAANALWNIEAGIESRVGRRTRLRSVLQDRYDTRPAEGVRHNDVTLLTGLALEL